MFSALRVAAVASALALVAVLPAASADGRPATTSSLQPAIQPALGGQCVADPAFMRRNHMTLLKHQRNETVHLGVRDARASLTAPPGPGQAQPAPRGGQETLGRPGGSLKGCIACHASPATQSVAMAPTDFCVSCHSYAAVKIDCFECHTSKVAAK